MKVSSLLLAVLTVTSLQVQASEEESAQWCLEFSKARAAKFAGKSVKDVKFHSSAILGDGINSIEIDVFQIKGLSGLVKVDTMVDGCDAIGQVLRLNY